MKKKTGKKTVRFAVFGCGKAGLNHIRALQNTPDAEIVAICDKRSEAVAKAAREFGISSTYTDGKQLFKNERLDAAAIITTTSGHHPLTMEAAKRNIHVILEKPIATSCKHAEEMVGACKKAGVILAVTFTYRFLPETRAMQKIISSGRLGKILEIRYLRYSGDPYKYPPGSDMRRQRDILNTKNGLGIVYDCGIHAIDLISWYAGMPPEKLNAWGTHHQGYDYPDTATCLLQFPNGIKGVYDYGFLTASHENLGVGMPLMSVIINAEKGSIIYTHGVKVAGRQDNTSYLEVLTKKQRKVQTFSGGGKGREIQYRQFIDSMRTGKLKGYFPDPEEAVMATRTAKEMLRKCLRNRIKSPLVP